jgi:hypothetical protein
MCRRALTGGGGLARIDVSDDDDVDMSLFFTMQVDNMSATLIDMCENTISMSKMRTQTAMDFAYPIVTVG